MPAAAPTFSTTIDWPSSSPMRCAWMRALTSTPPPAANGTTKVIGRVGQSCAAAPAQHDPERERAEGQEDREQEHGDEETRCSGPSIGARAQHGSERGSEGEE